MTNQDRPAETKYELDTNTIWQQILAFGGEVVRSKEQHQSPQMDTPQF